MPRPRAVKQKNALHTLSVTSFPFVLKDMTQSLNPNMGEGVCGGMLIYSITFSHGWVLF